LEEKKKGRGVTNGDISEKTEKKKKKGRFKQGEKKRDGRSHKTRCTKACRPRSEIRRPTCVKSAQARKQFHEVGAYRSNPGMGGTQKKDDARGLKKNKEGGAEEQLGKLRKGSKSDSPNARRGPENRCRKALKLLSPGISSRMPLNDEKEAVGGQKLQPERPKKRGGDQDAPSTKTACPKPQEGVGGRLMMSLSREKKTSCAHLKVRSQHVKL